MRHNLTKLISQTMVDQFENVVKEEIRSHNLAIEKNNKELSDFKELFFRFKRDYENLRHEHIAAYQSMEARFAEEKRSMEKSFQQQSQYLGLNEKELRNIVSHFQTQINDLATKENIRDTVSDFETSLAHVMSAMNDMGECLRDEMHVQKKLHDKNVKMFLFEIGRIVEKFEKMVADQEKSLQTHAVDAAGVLKELQVYKKSMFVIEKKIENLYTLVGRLQQRIGS